MTWTRKDQTLAICAEYRSSSAAMLTGRRKGVHMNKTMNKNKDAAPRRWGEITDIALGYQRCPVAAALPWDHERHASKHA